MSNTTFIKSTERGTSLTLPEGIKGVTKGITLFTAKRKDIKELINALAVASVQVCLDHSKDDSAIRKIAEALLCGGDGRGSDYATYLRFLDKCGLKVDYETPANEDEIATMVVHKKEFSKNITSEEGRKKLNEFLYDTLTKTEAGIHAAFQSKAKRKPRGKAPAKNAEEEASAVADVAPVDVALVKLRTKLAAVAGEDPKRVAMVMKALEHLADIGLTMDQPANLNQMLESKGIYKALDAAPKAQSWVDKIAAAKAS